MSRRPWPLRASVVITMIAAAAGCSAEDDASIALPGLDGAPAPAAPASPTLPGATSSPPTTTSDPVEPPTDTADGLDEDGATPTSSTLPAEATTTSPAPPTTEASGEAEPDVFLRRGDEGPEVASMQQRLIVLEYLAPGGDTGVFDGATADALIDFQAQYGLIVDGIFGPQTDRALNAAAASVAAG